MKDETREKNSHWALTPRGFGEVIAHTQAPKEGAFKDEGPTPFWTYKEQDKNGQISFVKASRDFEVRLDPTQLDFVCFYNMVLTNQLKDLSTIKKSEDVGGLIGKLFQATNIFFDVNEFAIITGKEEKQARRIVNNCIDVFQDRIYHWFAKVFDPRKKENFFVEYDTPLIIPHYEADATTGRRIKNGRIVLEVPLQYVKAMIETGHYYYFPDWFFKINGKNCQTLKYLALRCIERYFQDKGKGGFGCFRLDTAIEYSGLCLRKNTKIQRKDGTTYKAKKAKSMVENVSSFDEAVKTLVKQGGFDEANTFYATDPEGKNRIDPEQLDPKKEAYFFFRLNDMKNYTPKIPKESKAESAQKGKPKKPRRMGGGITQAGAIDPDAPENGA